MSNKNNKLRSRSNNSFSKIFTAIVKAPITKANYFLCYKFIKNRY